MNSKFTPDPNLLKIAEAYALDCVDFFATKFRIRLDFSPNSIPAIEQCLEVFHVQMAAAAPKPEQIELFSKMFGSYLGETYRRAYGGVWGVSSDGQPSLQSPGGLVCFPWGRAHKRIVNGAEDNVQHWFEYLVEHGCSHSGTSSPHPPAPPPHQVNASGAAPLPPAPKAKGFFSRLFGG